jgi:hypothetical protein
VLAMLAVFHFVRQQYGWVNLYRAKLKEKSNLTWWIDAAAIYLATVYPLAFWMTSLPRNFNGSSKTIFSFCRKSSKKFFFRFMFWL